jgi:hypothetical protein
MTNDKIIFGLNGDGVSKFQKILPLRCNLQFFWFITAKYSNS